MCGESNVIYWLAEHGHAPDRPLVEHIYRLAKQRESVFEDVELEAVVLEFKRTGSGAAARG
jgi:hypothetical protein